MENSARSTPAPPSERTTVAALRRVILDASRTLWERYQALFGLRNKNQDDSANALGEALLRDPSALLRHECAYVVGQMQREDPIPYDAVARDWSPRSS
ncbi:MAG TPA: hypothetical protein VGB18_09640 [Candidatus Thermoplasmatota archaeon]